MTQATNGNDRRVARSRERRLDRLEITRIGIEFGVPTGEAVHPARQPVEILDARRAAAHEVEAHAAHAGGIEAADFLVGHARRDLNDADEGRTEPCQRVEHASGIEALERSGYDATACDAQVSSAFLVRIYRKRGRHEPLVLLHREPKVDDVEMGVEQASLHGIVRDIKPARAPSGKRSSVFT